ncbi:hypothetical protein GF359_10505 [candidate division WOR-3 bacterium]|uniref:DNA-directed RNA polymerase RpoA/D/Rpb3-type domain-containing protein n=1 Tax=candidate division WOR-3 bacterium TaxID=2052148 RepID=A0A9D5KAR1_UNCW3|nr:hypothetical protein [candidate division WOR-3 bacterium]MBD3365632.1 hypothetical protein [candidate division WOR-3 bacterium]
MEGLVSERRKYIKIPETVEVDREVLTPDFGRFTLGPLARGWGWTMGTVIRRAMLSSVEGVAPTQLRIDGVIHEFSTLEGVLEDVPLIVLNVKKLRFKLEGEGPEYARLHATSPSEYKGGDLELSPNLTLVNKDQHLLTVTVDNRPAHLEIKLERGRGYENQETVKKRSPGEPEGTIFLDAFYSPVRRVKLDVTNVRYGERTDYEQIVFEVATDGTISPEQTLSQTADLLKGHVEALYSIAEPKDESSDSLEVERPEWMDMKVESLEVPQTVKKVLADHGLKTVSEVVSLTEAEIVGWGEIKPRSFAILRSRIQDLGAEFASDEKKSDADDEEEEDET